MNYYERHLGDYAKDTGHLTILEHGAYTLLLDRIYSTEAGIPEKDAHRLARARTAAEKAAVAVGDTITKVGDTAVDGPQAVSAAINSKKAGDTVTLTIVRGTEELKVDVVLGKRVATQQYAIPTSPGGGTITPGNGNLVPITPAPAETSAAPGTSA